MLLISPLIASCFVGSAWPSVAAAGAGVVPRWNPALYSAPAIAAGGAALAATTDVIDARTVGVLMLWTVAAAQVGLGVALWRRA